MDSGPAPKRAHPGMTAWVVWRFGNRLLPAASSPQIRSAIHMHRLPGNVARGGAAEESHRRCDILRRAARAGDGAVGEMMRGLGLALWPGSADQAGHHAIHRDAVVRQVMR